MSASQIDGTFSWFCVIYTNMYVPKLIRTTPQIERFALMLHFVRRAPVVGGEDRGGKCLHYDCFFVLQLFFFITIVFFAFQVFKYSFVIWHEPNVTFGAADRMQLWFPLDRSSIREKLGDSHPSKRERWSCWCSQLPPTKPTRQGMVEKDRRNWKGSPTTKVKWALNVEIVF